MSVKSLEELHSGISQFRDGYINGELKSDGDRQIAENLAGMAAHLGDHHQHLVAALKEKMSEPVSLGPIHLNGKEEMGLELYWALHWIDNPPAWFKSWAGEHPVYHVALEILEHAVKDLKGLLMCKETHDWLMAHAKTPGLVGNDGTIYGLATYEQLDEGWMISALNYVVNVVCGGIHEFTDIAITPAPLSAKNDGADAVLGIVGDWGGGDYDDGGWPSPAMRVRADIETRGFDYLVHLGDTYYAGTDGVSRLGKNSGGGEELANLVKVWPDHGKGRNYTLNSNHEMYGAAQGYFNVALRQSGLFDQQNGASYFAMEHKFGGEGKSWLILGLDSAFYSDQENGHKMYMEGALWSNRVFDKHQAQKDRIAALVDGHDGPIMLMTHHNPWDTVKGTPNKLFAQAKELLGRDPTLWYWGHVHNGIVYDQIDGIATRGRCCGHGAVPYGNGWGLSDTRKPLYYANTPDPAYPADNPRVCNGYAAIKFHDDGSITETFYEIRGVGEPGVEMWSDTLAPAQFS